LDLNEPIAAQCSQPVSFVGIRDAVDFGIYVPFGATGAHAVRFRTRSKISSKINQV
jgi:hypothetical protein